MSHQTGNFRKKGTVLQRNLLAVAIIVSVVFVTKTDAFGQAHLNSQQKLQYIGIAAQAANQAVAKGEVGPARAVLYGVTQMVARMMQSGGGKLPQVAAYFGAVQKAWPDAPAQPTQETLGSFFTAYKESSKEIKTMALEFQLTPPPSGKWQYWEKVANIKARDKDADKLLGAFAMKCPPPTHLLMLRPILQKAAPALNEIYTIVFGPMMAGMHAKQGVIPAVQKEIEAHLAKTKTSKSIIDMQMMINDLNRAMKVLQVLDNKNPKLADYDKGIALAEARLTKLYEEMVTKNRMPKDRWTGPNRSQLLAQVSSLVKARYPKDKIKAVRLASSDWNEGWYSWWQKDVLISRYVGRCDANVAVKHPTIKGRCTVRRFGLQRDRLSGRWSAVYLAQPKGAMPMLCKNL